MDATIDTNISKPISSASALQLSSEDMHDTAVSHYSYIYSCLLPLEADIWAFCGVFEAHKVNFTTKLWMVNDLDLGKWEVYVI